MQPLGTSSCDLVVAIHHTRWHSPEYLLFRRSMFLRLMWRTGPSSVAMVSGGKPPFIPRRGQREAWPKREEHDALERALPLPQTPPCGPGPPSPTPWGQRGFNPARQQG